MQDRIAEGGKPGSASRPVTYDEASGSGRTWLDARHRYDELTQRDLSARTRAGLVASGQYDPVVHGTHDATPLTLREHLEVLANGAVLARVYHNQVEVDRAVQAGASWEQVAAALATTEARARTEYRQWAEGQHRLWQLYSGKFGLDDKAYADAMARTQAGRFTGDEDDQAVILAALDEAAAAIRERASYCADCRAHPAELCDATADQLRRAAAYDALADRLR